MKILLVIDLQNDFIDGALGTKEAQAILPAVLKKIREFEGPVFATMDLHGEEYLSTQEGAYLPVRHCIRGTQGAELRREVAALLTTTPFEKSTFGSLPLAQYLIQANRRSPIEEVELIGLCTDICVISNAMILKAALPETRITVDSSCCAGVTPESHRNALKAMSLCQIQVI